MSTSGGDLENIDSTFLYELYLCNSLVNVIEQITPVCLSELPPFCLSDLPPVCLSFVFLYIRAAGHITHNTKSTQSWPTRRGLHATSVGLPLVARTT